jgi:hypothetical protein
LPTNKQTKTKTVKTGGKRKEEEAKLQGKEWSMTNQTKIKTRVLQ